MSKKILVLTASSHKNGNTFKLAEAFIRGAESAGNEVMRFDTAFMNIGGCNACNTCWSTGPACTVRDDFAQLEPALESCDVLLISTPLFWFSFPQQIKGAIDRLYAYGGTGGPRPLTIKESYFFVCGGDADEEEYQPILATYRNIASYLGWTDKGVIRTGGLNGDGDVEKSGLLEKAEEMGRNV